ncbi:hypothetical protein [Vibrio cyclitrophicus]|uniref:hypothetical protein n=1 Tax=Vibrio cyclitrophicus TaxID=47951 RepID=UPI0007EECAFF|nr:hypothetical protein [Vibrio cyclitrophicus]OBT04389.1 hypothetical protein A9265_17565 [Vibrio cyclitrophicus]PMK82374.1 hypothetical protein BCT91_00990 [Vibrio cyclitrophicus]
MISKLSNIITFYKDKNGINLFIASFFLAISRIMKIAIMIVPLQIVLMMGSNQVPKKIENLLPDDFSSDITRLLIIIITAFVLLLVTYVFVSYKTVSLRRKSLDKVFIIQKEFIIKTNKGKQVFAKLLDIQSDVILNIICLTIILLFNSTYFLFCLALVIFSYYLFESIFLQKITKNVEFITELYSLAIYLLMVSFLAYSAYANSSNLLHLVPIFFVSRMIVISMPRVLRNRLTLKKLTSKL